MSEPEEEESPYSRHLAAGQYLGGLVAATGDHRGCCQIMTCAARVELVDLDPNEPDHRRLSVLMEKGRRLRDPAQQVAQMRQTFSEFLGGRPPEEVLKLPAVTGDELTVIRRHLELVIELGALACIFNDWVGSYEMYAAVARMILATRGGAPGVSDRLQAALWRSERQRGDPCAQSCTLRNAFSFILPLPPDSDPTEVAIWRAEGDRLMQEELAKGPPKARSGCARLVGAVLATVCLVVLTAAGSLALCSIK